ncbi:hypothetical protein [Marinobacter salarius]|uniref:Uncharacterized protein n=1 Tax=Marinobacter salarius TaxID=1420917 RepID=A0A1W6KFJ1_9GAMM|nr:hypothetical protein [Marinobacter salarius]ARM86177.1 hypothetical protein MARSALSMR5_04157 [Marinobacter salarius]
MKSVPFFSDDITIVPHSASPSFRDEVARAKPITVKEFTKATGQPVSLYEMDNGDLLLQSTPRLSHQTPVFIEGVEAV